MKPGERVRLIKESADSLMTRPWPEVQLVLSQFGFQTWDTDRYDIEPHQYVIDRIKDGDDGEVLTLHEYLMGDDAAPGGRRSDEPWGSLPGRAFLSHIHAERAFAGEVKTYLARMGIEAFVAHDDIDPSKQWREVIRSALATCHVFVACLHDGFHASQWCDQEVGWALGRNIPILPVRLGTDRRDGFLADFQDAIPFPSNSAYWVADRIFDTFLGDARTSSVGTRALVEAFVGSTSYDRTRRFWTLLDTREHIETEQLRRLEYAVATNRQVYEAVDKGSGELIPDLVRSLIDRFEPPTPSPPSNPWDDEPPF